ncbi:Myeloid leukemia factor [Armadillidium nasatum]|uniref:Myeloid leukemia factor n=1 Tax=Armadillidium nasatum TaxID=96803 RepID=A0A5N5SM56_9CRUS|nr:Myeloid leukemia factor [Armadillidium nasatum]
MSIVPYTGSRDRSYGRSLVSSSRNDFPGTRDFLSSSFGDRSYKRPTSFRQDFLGGDDFDDIFDSAFSSSRNLFSHMNTMMNSMMRDPFREDPYFRGSAFPALMMGPSAAVVPADNRRRQDPFGLSHFGGMMSSMENMMKEGSCHTYSSSSVMTMTTGPDGRPQVYQASSSSRGVPGGVRETRRTEADSRTGMKKMAIGHHIEDRSHVIEKEMAGDGAVEEKEEFVNLDETEAESFNNEFRRKTQQVLGAIEQHPRPHRATTSPSRQRYLPALPSSSRANERARHRERGVGRTRNPNERL